MKNHTETSTRYDALDPARNKSGFSLEYGNPAEVYDPLMRAVGSYDFPNVLRCLMYLLTDTAAVIEEIPEDSMGEVPVMLVMALAQLTSGAAAASAMLAGHLISASVDRDMKWMLDEYAAQGAHLGNLPGADHRDVRGTLADRLSDRRAQVEACSVATAGDWHDAAALGAFG